MLSCCTDDAIDLIQVLTALCALDIELSHRKSFTQELSCSANSVINGLSVLELWTVLCVFSLFFSLWFCCFVLLCGVSVCLLCLLLSWWIKICVYAVAMQHGEFKSVRDARWSVLPQLAVGLRPSVSVSPEGRQTLVYSRATWWRRRAQNAAGTRDRWAACWGDCCWRPGRRHWGPGTTFRKVG